MVLSNMFIKGRSGMRGSDCTEPPSSCGPHTCNTVGRGALTTDWLPAHSHFPVFQIVVIIKQLT